MHNNAFFVEEYQTQYFEMGLNTQYSITHNTSCSQKQCKYIENQLEITKEILATKKKQNPEIELAPSTRQYSDDNRSGNHLCIAKKTPK